MVIIILDLLWVIFGGAYVGARCLHDKHNMNRRDFWWTNKNYNLKRQYELNSMCFMEREKIEEMLGHPIVVATIIGRRAAVEEILRREGYDYYDQREDVKEWARATGTKYQGL